MRTITLPTMTVRVLVLGSAAAALCFAGTAPALALAGESSVRLCHALDGDTGATGWESRTIAPESVYGNGSGHVDEHEADIIPAFSYTKDGATRQFPGKNWYGAFLEIHANGCVAPAGQGTEQESTDPVVEEQTTDPVDEEQTTDPVDEEQTTDPVDEEQTTDPVDEEQTTDPPAKEETFSPSPRVVRTFGSPVPRLRTVVSTTSSRSWNGSRLPRTGIEMETLVGGAGLLLLAGAVAVVATRRRPEDQS